MATAPLTAAYFGLKSPLPAPFPSTGGQGYPPWPSAGQFAPGIRVLLALGADPMADPDTWSFTDITSSVYYRSKIMFFRGRSGAQSEAGPSWCRLSLKNHDFRYSRRNPTGPYYGLLNPNTPLRIDLNPGTGWQTAYTGFIAEWPPRSDTSGNDRWIEIAAYGTLRRVEAAGRSGGESRSAMKRTILAQNPAEYWSMEDGSSATGFASVVGGRPLRLLSGSFTPGAFSDLAGAVTSPDLTGGAVLLARVREGSSDAWTVQIVFKLDPTSIAARALTLPISGGTDESYLLQMFTDIGEIQFDAINPNGADRGVLAATVIAIADGGYHHYMVTAAQNGTDIDFALMIDGTVEDTATLAGTLGRIVESEISEDTNLDDDIVSVAHFAIHDGVVGASAAAALDGYAGETALARFKRNCDEEGIPCWAVGVPEDSEPMGPQPVGTLMDVVRECERADAGLLDEAPDSRLRLTSRTARTNRPVTLALDWANLDPDTRGQEDDRDINNDVTVFNTDGSSARSVQTTGPLAVSRVGRYARPDTLNLADDDRLGDHAGWRRHLGTVDEPRLPTITVELSKSANRPLIAAWLGLTTGSRVGIDNPPLDYGPDPLDQLVEGLNQTVDQLVWTGSLVASPASPYRVGTLAEDAVDTDDYLIRLHPDVCYSVDAHDSDDTSWSVLTDPPWTETADDFPCPVRVGGEVATLTAVAPAAADAFGRSETDGWGTPDTGAAYTLIGTAADFDVAAGVGTITPSTLGADRIAWVDVGCRDQYARVVIETNTTPVGGAFRAGLALRVIDSANHYRAVVRVDTSGLVTAEVSRRATATFTTLRATPTNLSIGTNIVVAAAVTTLARADGTPYARLRLRAWQQTQPEPWVWTVEYEDESPLSNGTGVGVFARLESGSSSPTSLDYDLFRVSEPKTWTLTRSVNGVVKSHAAGAEIEIDDPTVLAL